MRHPPISIGRFVSVMKPVGMPEHALCGKALSTNGAAFRTATAVALALRTLVGLGGSAQFPAGLRLGLLCRRQTLVLQGALGTVRTGAIAIRAVCVGASVPIPPWPSSSQVLSALLRMTAR